MFVRISRSYAVICLVDFRMSFVVQITRGWKVQLLMSFLWKIENNKWAKMSWKLTNYPLFDDIFLKLSSFLYADSLRSWMLGKWALLICGHYLHNTVACSWKVKRNIPFTDFEISYKQHSECLRQFISLYWYLCWVFFQICTVYFNI